MTQNNQPIPSYQYAGFITHSATSRQGEKGKFSHLGSTSINISHCIYHYDSPQCRHTAAKQSAHITQATRTF